MKQTVSEEDWAWEAEGGGLGGGGGVGVRMWSTPVNEFLHVRSFTNVCVYISPY